MTILDPELRELLHRIDDLAPPAPPLPTAPSEPYPSVSSRRRLVGAFTSVVLVFAAAVGIVMARRSSSHSTAPATSTTTAAQRPPSLLDLETILGGHTWTLTAIDGVVTDAPFTLGVLPQGSVGGRVDCNDYSLDDTTPDEFGHWTFTQSAVGCPGTNGVAIAHVIEIIANTTAMATNGSSLTLTDAKGHQLTFGRETPTTFGDLHVVMPARLTYTAQGWVSTMEGVSAFYSNVPLGPSCSNGGCGWPIHALPPNSIVVAWGSISGPIATDQPQGMAPNTTVGGRPATKTTDLAEGCRSIGGTASVVVNIRPDNKMRACMRGPDLEPLRADVDAMLSSVTFG